MADILEPVTNPSVNMSILAKMCALFSNRVMLLVLRLLCYIWMDELHYDNQKNQAQLKAIKSNVITIQYNKVHKVNVLRILRFLNCKADS